MIDIEIFKKFEFLEDAMEILVLTQQYPKENDLYKNNFVHTRLKSYLNSGADIEVTVFVPKKRNSSLCSYNYDGINVFEGNIKDFNALIMNQVYDKIIIHFLISRMVPFLLSYFQNTPKLIWIHGYEALSWKRRLFNIKSPDFIRYCLSNTLQLKSFRNYDIKQRNSQYIFVSNWMRDITKIDIGSNFKQYHIIPNGIDTAKYFFEEKDEKIAKKVLLIRPFNSRKYATDIAMKSIYEFSKDKTFNDFEFTIVGEGKYFEKDTKRIADFGNVNLVNRFLTPDEIKEFHSQHGIFLCPTRQDAQGVSMCEAMSSGLIPISSNNTAIPEFVEDGVSGYLTNNVKEIVQIFQKLGRNEIQVSEISRNARKQIEQKCSLEIVTQEELKLILNESMDGE